METQKIITYSAIGVAGIVCLVFLLDLAAGIFGRNVGNGHHVHPRVRVSCSGRASKQCSSSSNSWTELSSRLGDPPPDPVSNRSPVNQEIPSRVNFDSFHPSTADSPSQVNSVAAAAVVHRSSSLCRDRTQAGEPNLVAHASL